MEEIVTEREIEILEQLKSLPLETDEDYQILGRVFDEDE